jgi:hypothetical protein
MMDIIASRIGSISQVKTSPTAFLKIIKLAIKILDLFAITLSETITVLYTIKLTIVKL